MEEALSHAIGVKAYEQSLMLVSQVDIRAISMDGVKSLDDDA